MSKHTSVHLCVLISRTMHCMLSRCVIVKGRELNTFPSAEKHFDQQFRLLCLPTSGMILSARPIKLCTDPFRVGHIRSLRLRLFLFPTILCPSRRSLADHPCVEGWRDRNSTHTYIYTHVHKVGPFRSK